MQVVRTSCKAEEKGYWKMGPALLGKQPHVGGAKVTLQCTKWCPVQQCDHCMDVELKSVTAQCKAVRVGS